MENITYSSSHRRKQTKGFPFIELSFLIIVRVLLLTSSESLVQRSVESHIFSTKEASAQWLSHLHLNIRKGGNNSSPLFMHYLILGKNLKKDVAYNICNILRALGLQTEVIILLYFFFSFVDTRTIIIILMNVVTMLLAIYL